jgi:hypothetical protein
MASSVVARSSGEAPLSTRASPTGTVPSDFLSEIEGREKQTTRRRSKVWLWLEVGRLGLSSEESLGLEVGRWASRWLSIELECCFCSSTR